MKFQSINPYTNEVLEEFETFDDQTIHIALSKAEHAFMQWRKTSFAHRADHLKKAASILRKEQAKFARTITLEMGKAIREAKAEVTKCAWVCDYFAENGEEFLKEDVIASDAQKSYVTYEPIGAILAIMPWNFPFWQVFRFAAPSLMAGNVGLLKHAPNVSRCALQIEEIFREAGFPEGVFQTLIVDVDKVEGIIEHPFVQAATLTGSERAGSSVAALAGKNIKKTVMELGGSDPFIVLSDADLENTAKVAVESRMLNAGQSCIAAKRFIVADPVREAFVEKVREHILQLQTGDPLEASTTTGPLARIDLAENIARQVQQSVEKGADLVLGGEQEGTRFQPALLLSVKPGMPAFDEETFGPAMTIIHAKNEAEAIELANHTRYGLGASIWTTDTDRGNAIAKEIFAGGVFINSLVKSDPRLPFGGVKKSGYGRELSYLGIKEFVNAKTVYIA